MTSYDWMFSLGLLPLGYVLAGPVADVFGATEVLFGGAVIAFVAFALGLRPARDADARAPRAPSAPGPFSG